MAIMSMFNPDPNAAMRQRFAVIDQQMQQQRERDRNHALHAASVRNYQATGQQIPPQLMAQLDPGTLAVARQHNQNLLQQQPRK